MHFLAETVDHRIKSEVFLDRFSAGGPHLPLREKYILLAKLIRSVPRFSRFLREVGLAD